MENTNLAAISQKDMVELVQNRLDELSRNNSIHFPANYSVPNALRSAWLIIQSTKDINQRPALSVCTRESVINALLNTVILGLNPAKNQIYYIVFGDILEAKRSYLGTMAVTKRVEGVKDIWADVVYEGDTFKVEKYRGNWKITEHISNFENINTDKIKAAYCTILKDNGEEYTEIMNMDQIQKAWNKSKTKTQTVHKEFPDQMAKKTVINRACKFIFNTSDDSDLMIDAFNQSGDQFEDHEETEPNAARAIDSRCEALNNEVGGISSASVKNVSEGRQNSSGEESVE